MNTYEAGMDAAGLRIGIAVARFNHLISVRLLEGCVEELVARGADGDAIDLGDRRFAAPDRQVQ